MANVGKGFPKLPEGYSFEEDGLGRCTAGRGGGKQKRICCDGIPIDIRKVLLKDDVSQTTKEGYMFSIENIYSKKSEPITCTMEEMRRGKLPDIIFPYVNFGTHPGARKEAGRVFEQIIKTACVGERAVEVYVNKFGWNGNRYIWDNPPEPDTGKEYANSVDICKLAIGRNIIIVVLIAALHGLMKKPLQDAGIRHDYVDVIVGKTGIGKSEPVKIICNYHVEHGNIYSVGSNRKAVWMQMEGNMDQTVVLDDFCKTKSDRVSATQDQLVSEIIQASSDAARVIIDKDSKAIADPALRRHIVMSAERMIKNESTINRCFIFNMEEPLPMEAFQKMKTLGKERGFFRFLVAMSRFVGGDNFIPQLGMMAKDYERYKSEADRLGTCTCGSDHRINETYAVQMVLVRVVIRYLKSLKLDEMLISKTDKAFTDCVGGVCKEMKTSINELHCVDTHKKYLEPLARIILEATDAKELQGYYVYHSEEKYQKNKNRTKDCVLFCIHDGYASFEGKCMCEIMDNEYGLKGANPKGLASDLQYYSLAYADGEGKLSCRWGTDKRYYHVRVKELLELISSDIDFIAMDRLERIFQKKQ
ncbi:MAG: hypothetical protein HFH97_01490 [Lachnospiraceae bacterium]|nr:hypothetical protein [uncultured Acetatifactor sp.]MCI9571275.1 hypothetical protein [Lachnospiraceae bacterium]